MRPLNHPFRLRGSCFPGQALLPALALTLALPLSATAGGAEAPVASPPAASADSGLKVNIDPATGRFLETPAPDAPAAAARHAAAAAAPLALEASPVPGGGVGFRVPDGRYGSEIRAAPSSSGRTEIRCDSPAK